MHKQNSFLFLVIASLVLAGCRGAPAPTQMGEMTATPILPLTKTPSLTSLPAQDTATITPTATQSPSPTPTSFPPLLHPGWTSFTNANFIRALLVDRQGDLWTGGNGGVVHWNTKDGTYIKYTAEHGLASNFVTSIAQAADGALWFGTYGAGVSCFDGVGWVTYTKQAGLVDDTVLSLAAAPDGTVWVGTLRGISSFDGKDWTTYTPENTNGVPIVRADALAIAPDGAVWIGRHWLGRMSGLGLIHSLIRFDGQESQDWSDALGEDTVTALAVEPDGTLWVGTRRGVTQYDGKSWNKFILSDNEMKAVSAVAVTPDGIVWVGFSDYELSHELNMLREANGGDQSAEFSGVYRYDGKSWRVVSTQDGLSNNEVRAIAVEPSGMVWFGTYNRGLSGFNGQEWRKLQTRDEMLTNVISDVGVSDSGIVWIGHTEGASRYDGRDWVTYDQIGDINMKGNYVFSLMVDRDDTVWFGTSDGVAHFDGTSWTTYPEEQYPHLGGVFTIVKLSDGTYLFGGAEGVTQFDGKGWNIFSELNDTFGILEMLELPNGNLWFADSFDGVYSYDGNTWKHYTEAAGLVSDQVNSIALAPNGKLWVSSCYGISWFDGKTWKIYLKGDVSEDGYPTFCASKDIVVDQSGTVWVGTERGLLCIEEDRLTTYATQDGLAENNIKDVFIGPDGAVWIGTYAGLSRFVPPGN